MCAKLLDVAAKFEVELGREKGGGCTLIRSSIAKSLVEEGSMCENGVHGLQFSSIQGGDICFANIYP